ncbi:MAG: hypothetical protein IKM43_02550 [Clostridia bacterium]|nr:hypothetical protein [Clostridia bacterium]
MLIDKIRKLAKDNKVMVFCDMDGVIAEYDTTKKHDIRNNVPNTYFNSRPLNHTISQLKKIKKIKNVEIGILSACYFNEQKQEKLQWLKLHANIFEDKNINIVVYENETFTQKTKDLLKVNKILEIVKNKNVVPILIEDNHNIIEATNKVIKNCAVHVSKLID